MQEGAIEIAATQTKSACADWLITLLFTGSGKPLSKTIC